MAERGLLQGVADEGGYWPAFDSNEAALDALMRAIERAGFTPGQEVAISLDIAASEFHANGRYRLALDGRTLDSDGMAEMLIAGSTATRSSRSRTRSPRTMPRGCARFTAAVGDRVQIVGDDFLVTNAERVRKRRRGACNAVLVKPNQAGTVTEAKAGARRGAGGRLGRIVSARSGETEDVTIVHLAVGWGVGPAQGRLLRALRAHGEMERGLRIEEALGGKVQVSVRALFPARRKARRSVDCPGSSFTSKAPRKPRVCSFGTTKVRVICPTEVQGTTCTCAGSER
jgi:enolase